MKQDDSSTIRIRKTIKGSLKEFCRAHTPRAILQYALEDAVIEYLDRHGWLKEEDLKLLKARN